MAKPCINCGCSIGMFSKSLKLSGLDMALCSNCAGKIEPLFSEINSADYIRTANQHMELEASFHEKLSCSMLNPVASAVTAKYFYGRQLAKSKLPVFVRSFEGDFAESYEMVKRAGDAAAKAEVTANIVEVEGAKSATFVYESGSISRLNDSMAVLIITLVNCNGRTTVVTKGASDLFGDFRGMNYSFWMEFEKQNPDLRIENQWKLDYSLR